MSLPGGLERFIDRKGQTGKDYRASLGLDPDSPSMDRSRWAAGLDRMLTLEGLQRHWRAKLPMNPSSPADDEKEQERLPTKRKSGRHQRQRKEKRMKLAKGASSHAAESESNPIGSDIEDALLSLY